MPRNLPPNYVPFPGSDRSPLVEARHIGPIDPEESVEVSIYLKDPAPEHLEEHLAKVKERQAVPRLSREDYIKKHSAKEEDIESFKAFARDNNLSVVDVDRPSRKIVLRGTASAISHAFGTELQEYEHHGKRVRARTGSVYLPADLSKKIASILGIDNRMQAESHIQRFSRVRTTFKANAVQQSYTVPDIAKLYDFPDDLDGSDQRIAIIELGGGFVQQDLLDYFQNLQIPMPVVTSVSVDGAQNSPTANPESADGEVDLDIEVVGAIAPKAAIDVYFAPNTDKGFIDAVNAAILNTRYPPSVISISWGAAETEWTQQARDTMNQALAAAATLGITVFCAAGDHGSTDGEPDRKNHVDFPASSPYATGCGGTRLESQTEEASNETVWNDNPLSSATGGGVSAVFDLPPWQVNFNVPLSGDGGGSKRGVPDIAADADPETGYQIHVDGADPVFGGTSAVAPLWAGLIALLNQRRKAEGKQHIGYLNPVLYLNYQDLRRANALKDIVLGNNGGYSAGPDWDACTGLGTPDGNNFVNLVATFP